MIFKLVSFFTFIDPCRRRNCSPLNALFSSVFTSISHGVQPLGGVKQGRGG